MKLYITYTSPYARIVRIVIIEKGLEKRVELIAAKTRTAVSPYYEINPSGRVPYLVCEDSTGLEDSALICSYLDNLDGTPTLDTSLAARRLEAIAKSMLDGLAVWARELYRVTNECSPTIIKHEFDRSQRMVDLWETLIDQPIMHVMHGPLNMAQITLISALQLETRMPDFSWRAGHPKLAAWADQIAQRPSVIETLPPPLQG